MYMSFREVWLATILINFYIMRENVINKYEYLGKACLKLCVPILGLIDMF
jgi:hypothetical protein